MENGQVHFSRDDRIKAANFSHICHAFAQKKVGSGFDISSAIFGSQIYHRFSPSIIEQTMVCLHL